ncbi:hypothetical protein ACEU59_09705 [Buttiauxella noackiae]|uniref:hypothetical protein n=1 Tax=Buttiauxella noackiae TaxID=82992 RepID=UPI0035A5F750
MNINPIAGKVNNLSIKALPPLPLKKKAKKTDEEVSATINFDNEVYLNNHNSKLFRVRYNISVSIPHQVEVNLEYDFDFQSDEAVDTSLPKSSTILSSVPAFAYPYIKSYIENILNMSGYGSTPLPYIDFLKNPMPYGKDESNEE